MSNLAFLDHQQNLGLKYTDICQNIFEREIFTHMYLEFISFILLEDKAKLKYLKIINSKEEFIVEFKINNQKKSFVINNKKSLNEEFSAKRMTQEEYEREIARIYQIERYLKIQNNLQIFSNEISTTMKNLFKDMNEFKSYIDMLETKENTHNHYLSKIYNIA
ncbi:hypothetical protein CSUB8523_1788 [Campylobacter subantarcticus LMG 24377]|uniref:Uncharacterized protein n=2 Tax=Campylobacter subantarcticus TaxID=497724 RepID=A0A0A8HBS0_9BACT|nr:MULTISPECIES: hypothetical protein [Campylobacter]EAJ1261474.1 hypothetical protein [Campylobacter lari]AJC91491.1 hypothetical protein CSUB8521_1687 [Campylobacter subantarcticus LMG 24374]AJC93263.1 hypothetical protein CSUB8523_1788 [Campylobacter subantarcticus LMG 24377]EAL3939591.1 hypothetical protein [Campylobacter lari]MPB98547.1 hypothetical protein [Campylobacter subantarcticus]